MNSHDAAVRQQYQDVVNAAVEFHALEVPREGWIVTVRNALGMNGAQLARRLGVSRMAVWQMEKKELTGAVSLGRMRDTAAVLGCRFVYAMVPVGDNIKDAIRAQATRKATEIVRQASQHMALEGQSLPPEEIDVEIERMSDDLVHEMHRNFWGDK